MAQFCVDFGKCMHKRRRNNTGNVTFSPAVGRFVSGMSSKRAHLGKVMMLKSNEWLHFKEKTTHNYSSQQKVLLLAHCLKIAPKVSHLTYYERSEASLCPIFPASISSFTWNFKEAFLAILKLSARQIFMAVAECEMSLRSQLISASLIYV